jgi:D-alanyl-D-alanine carboxypeptidase
MDFPPEQNGRKNTLLGFAEAAQERGHFFFYVLIPGHIQPVKRGERFEDPLQAALEKEKLGEVTGGGSQMGEGKMSVRDLIVRFLHVFDAQIGQIARALTVSAMSVALVPGIAQARNSLHDKISAYLRPYVSTGNFSGSILVVKSGKTLFQNSYGLSDVHSRAPNRVDTKYHIASLSMQFTAAAAMRLVEDGKLSLDTKVSEIVADVPNGQRITVRELLQENSGLPDANDLPGFDELLNAHQTPETLVQFIRDRPPIREPGGKSQGEEHSAYNLLALIIEKKTGLPFKEAMRREVFAPLKMNHSGIDDDGPIEALLALGHVENGPVSLKAAPRIHWSAKTGNASVCSTIGDEHRWLAGFFRNAYLSDAHRQEILGWGDGYGWTTTVNPRLKEPVYFMNGQSPGFTSIVIFMPKLNAEIIILSNSQIPVPTPMGFDLAAMLEGGEYHAPELRVAPLGADEISHVVGRFKFGPDFFRPNATLELAAGQGGLILRWPGGPDSPVLVTDSRHFIDRHYWIRFGVGDDASGHASELTYGKFRGQRLSDGAPPSVH